jgi:hypothetical protein
VAGLNLIDFPVYLDAFLETCTLPYQTPRTKSAQAYRAVLIQPIYVGQIWLTGDWKPQFMAH